MKRLVAEVGLIHGSGFEVVNGMNDMSGSTRHNAIKAAELLSEGTLEKVICSGRGPVAGESYATTEAQLMADFLVRSGIHSSRIELEDTSTSTISNWVRSAPIIEGLGAETVMGITAAVNIGRMQRIGSFVSDKSTFDLVGYTPSGHRATPGEQAREVIGRGMTRHFLAVNSETPVSALDETYETYKSQFGLVALKRFLNRDVAEAAVPIAEEAAHSQLDSQLR